MGAERKGRDGVSLCPLILDRRQCWTGSIWEGLPLSLYVDECFGEPVGEKSTLEADGVGGVVSREL